MSSILTSYFFRKQEKKHDEAPPRRPNLSLWTTLTHSLYKMTGDINWAQALHRICSYSYVLVLGWFLWLMLPLPGYWNASRTRAASNKAIGQVDVTDYFSSFKGFSECNIKGLDLYFQPQPSATNDWPYHQYCSDLKSLLSAISNGGRIGFDAPYQSKGCRHRWYNVPQICMILERFESIIFVGDDSLQSIYNGFNILLRQDLTHGSLQTWDMDAKQMGECRCDNQFIKPSCMLKYVTSSAQVMTSPVSNYACQRIQHAFIKIGASPLSGSVVSKFESFTPRAPPSSYKHIPIIYSVSPYTSSSMDATKSMLSMLKLADESRRKTDMLYIGPTAAGHIDIKDRKGNQEIWDFHQSMARVAEENDIEVLGMWNLTVQASSWDGMHFGEKVAITQAMMIIDWLARLRTT